MVNPGAFSGTRRQFLHEQQELYAQAVDGNHVADTVADIQRRYFKRYPITIPHNEEPTAEFLASVDNNAPDPELTQPTADGMEDEEYARALRVYHLQVAELKMRKGQIRRRLQYEYSKARNEKPTFDIGSNNPMAILMAKLTGTTVQKPRQKTAYNIWGPQNRALVDPVFRARVADGNIPASKHAALRSSLYKELFEKLPNDEQKEWHEMSEKQHQEALDKIKLTLKAGASTLPADRQRVIEALPQFVEPILDLIGQYTGWKVTLIAGGPEPADGGRLNMISIHSGVTSGSTKMNFGRSERKAYKDNVVPTFGKFLKKCYSLQECRASALGKDTDFVGLVGIQENSDIDVHAFEYTRNNEDREEYVKVTPPMGINASAKSSVSAAAQATPGHITSGSPSTAPPAASSVKIGPPKGSKKTAAPKSPLNVDVATQPETTTAPRPVTKPGSDIPHSRMEELDLSDKSHPDQDAASRGPTPLASRAPTPNPDTCPSPAPTAAHSIASPPTGDEAPPATAPLSAVRLSASVPTGDDGDVQDRNGDRNVPDSAAPVSTPAPPTPDHSAARVSSSIPPTSDHVPSCNPITAPTEPVSRTAPSGPPPGSAAVPAMVGCEGPTVTTKKPRKRKAPPTTDSVSASKKTRSSASTSGAEKRKSPDESVDSIAKKQKTIGKSDDISRTDTIVIPENSPPWMENAATLFKSIDLGSEWRSLVSLWLAFENSQVDGSTKLGSQNRPRVISDWIQRARSAKFQPDIKNVDKFKAEFTAWWRSLQPEWRLLDGSDDLFRGEGDWQVLRRSGANGLVSVIAAIFFWGSNITSVNKPNVRGDWLAAIDEVKYAVSQII